MKVKIYWKEVNGVKETYMLPGANIFQPFNPPSNEEGEKKTLSLMLGVKPEQIELVEDKPAPAPKPAPKKKIKK